MANETDLYGPIIYSFTRAEAISNGVLVDVTTTAKEVGFKLPVAVTRDVWDQLVAWTELDTHLKGCQDVQGRLWDMLFLLFVAIKKCKNNASELLFTLNAIPKDGKSTMPVLHHLKSMLGVGDNGEAVITIMFPHED